MGAARPARGAPCTRTARRARIARERRLSRGNRGAMERDERSGAVAIRTAKLVGYLLGAQREDESWGPNIWVEYAGHAVRSPRTCAISTQRLRRAGSSRAATLHYALVPATDAELVDAWFRLWLRRTARQRHPGDAGSTEVTVACGIEIRRPSADGGPRSLTTLDLGSARSPGAMRPSSHETASEPGGVPKEGREISAEVDDTGGRALHRRDRRRRSSCGALDGQRRTLLDARRARRPERRPILDFAATSTRRRAAPASASALTHARPRLGATSTATRPWSPTGGRRTCSPRASGRGAAFAGRSCGCTARSRSGARADGLRLAARRRGGGEGCRRDRASAAGGGDRRRRRRRPGRAALSARRSAAGGARPARRPRDDPRRAARAPDPGPLATRARPRSRRPTELERTGAPTERQTLLVAAGLARRPLSGRSRGSSTPSSRGDSRAGRGARRREPRARGRRGSRHAAVRVHPALVEPTSSSRSGPPRRCCTAAPRTLLAPPTPGCCGRRTPTRCSRRPRRAAGSSRSSSSGPWRTAGDP